MDSSAIQVEQISTHSGDDFITYTKFGDNRIRFETPDFFNPDKTIEIKLNFTNCVPGRIEGPECYSEEEIFNVHVINDAPEIQAPSGSTVSMFDGLTETIVLVSSDYE